MIAVEDHEFIETTNFVSRCGNAVPTGRVVCEQPPRRLMASARHITLIHEPGEFAEARAAEKAANARQCAVAARTVASYAENAADCESLLAMLGLDAEAGKQAKVADHG
ncbi:MULTISPECIES: hypothetical protein [Nocardia]|uniref:hypothetical protein n=1 Tax=Nocardia TaxID=1817 RepID=UPI001FE086CC|nr:hypothetical protein [Nocardia exalbida]